MPQPAAETGKTEGSPYARHVPALDGVRGLAILLVMASHLISGNPHNGVERLGNTALAFGATGVDLFFVLSGFLITGILFDSQNDQQFFRKFYARRALRILPLYYGVILVYAIVAAVQQRSSGGELLSLACYLQNTSLIAVPIALYHGAFMLPLGHFWSLAVEEQFYLVWPLLVFLLRTRTRLLAICTFSIFFCPALRYLVWIHGAAYSTVHVNTLCRADALLLGGALALCLRSRLHDRVLSLTPWLAPLVLLVFLQRAFASPANDPFVHRSAALGVVALTYSALAFGYMGLIAWALADSPARRLFSTRPLRFLGKYSYGLYVLHLILLAYLERPLRAFLEHLHVGKGATVVAVAVIGFGASIAAAVLSYQLYERQFLKLKRYFDYRPHGQRRAPAVASAEPAVPHLS